MNGFNLSAYQSADTFFCYFNGDDIVQTDLTGATRIIGKKIETYSELEKTTQQYYDKLVELGVIVPPKTPEQQNKELQEQMLQMAGIMESLKKEIEELKNNEFKRTDSSDIKDVAEYKPKRSSRTSTTDNREHTE